MRIDTQLVDIEFVGKGKTISLASLGYHVEKQGLNSIFAVPSYGNINSVDWYEYDGEDVDFSSCSVNPLDMSFKVFGDGDEAIDNLINGLRSLGLDNDIEVRVVLQEDTQRNVITFLTKFNKAVKNKSFIEWHEFLYEKIFSDDFSADFVTEWGELWRHLAYVTLTFTRHSNDADFGLLANNCKSCIGIPNITYTGRYYPRLNVPVELRRYSISGRTATLVSTFNMYDNLVFAYTLKGVIQGLTGIAESKTPFKIATEGMVGQVMQTKKANKRKSKDITLPLLIRSNSVSAIFSWLGKYKQYVHTTLTSGDMLYLHCDRAGDYAIYPTGCNVTRSYIDGQWVEMTLSFCCYKEGFDFSADTDCVQEDNPEPVLPPAPPSGFDPYKNIDKTRWIACAFHTSMKAYEFNYCSLVSMRDPENHDGLHYPFNTVPWMLAGNGWSCYSYSVNRYPVGTLFFAQRNWYLDNGTKVYLYNTMICLPWCVKNLDTALFMYSGEATSRGWNNSRMTLVGVVQGCDLLAKNIQNWNVELQEAPSYGGLVGRGSVRVHSDVMTLKTANKFDIANNLVLSSSDDFDLLIDNMIEEFEADPSGSGYYTETGYNDRNKIIV